MQTTYNRKVFYHITGEFRDDRGNIYHYQNQAVRLLLADAEAFQAPDFKTFVAYDNNGRAFLVYQVSETAQVR
jgi:hypothetical protein